MPHSPRLLAALALLLAACDPDPLPSFEPIPRSELGDVEVADALEDGLRAPTGHMGWTSAEQGVGDDGQAAVTIPIVVPPGRAGMQPTLALSYNSGVGDGPMGVGWQLAGLSALTRCARDVGRDGVRNDRIFDDVLNGTEPALCLDGERLVPNDCSSGCDPDDPFSGADYRLESSGTVVVDREGALNGIDTVFVVRTRDGGVREYGGRGAVMRSIRYTSTPETAAVPGGTEEEPEWGAPDAVTYAWLLRERRDTSGNTIEVEYSGMRVDHALEVLPSAIHYTGHGGTRGSRRVEFTYEERLDDPVNFVSGFALGAFRRLAQVTTYAPGVDGPVRSYDLRYRESDDTGRALLSEVQECSLPLRGNTCRQPLSFEYSARGMAEVVSDFTLPYLPPDQWAIADIDGDGAHELIVDDRLLHFEQVVVGSVAMDQLVVDRFVGGSTPIGIYDYNFDGIDELMMGVGGRVYSVTEQLPVPGAYFFEAMEVSRLTETCSAADPDAELLAGNFDAATPGIDARIKCGQSGSAVLDLDGDGVHEAQLPGDVFLPEAPDIDRVSYRSFTTDDSSFEMTRLYEDMNADGLTDAVGFVNPVRPLVWTNTGEGFLEPRTQPVDISQCTGPEAACTSLSNIDFGWSDLSDSTPEHSQYRLRHRQEDMRVADINNDGLPDLFVLLAVRWLETGYCPALVFCDNGRVGFPWVFINRGDHFVPIYVGEVDETNGVPFLVPYEMTVDGSRYTGSPDAQGAFTHALMDLDGDGNMDVVLPSLARRMASGTSDRLTRVVVDDTETGTYEYAALAEVHFPGETAHCGDDVRCERYGFAVASHTTGVGRTFDHQYAGRRFDMARQELLGFESHRVTDRDTGEFVERTFGSDTVGSAGRHSTSGRPVFELRMKGSPEDGYEVNTRVTTYVEIDYASGQVRPTYETRIESIVDRTHELLGAEQCRFPCEPQMALAVLSESADLLTRSDRSFAYDEFGSLRLVQHSVPGELVTITEWTFENRPGQFQIGLPHRVTTSSSSTLGDAATSVDEFGHDELGRLTTVVHFAEDVSVVERYSISELDEYGAPIEIFESGLGADARTTLLSYDADHTFPRTLTNALGHVTDMVTHPALGALVYMRDPNERVTTSAVDGFGRIVETVTPTGRSSNEFVSDGGLEVRQVTSGTPERRVRVDLFGRPTYEAVAVPGHPSTASPGYWAEKWIQWHPDGRVDRVIESDMEGNERGERPVTRYFYDARDRVTRVARNIGDGPVRELERFSYAGRSTAWVDADEAGATPGATRTLTRDLAGRVVRSDASSTEGDQSLEYTYGAFGRLLRTVDDAGNDWSREYDYRGRLVRMFDADAGVRRYVYDGYSQLLETQSDDGEVLQRNTFDVLGRPALTQERDESGADLHETVFTWDPIGNLGELESAYRAVDDVLREFQYDDVGQTVLARLTVGGDAFEFEYGYDSDGQLTRIDYPETPAYADTPGGRLRVQNLYVEGRLSEVRNVDTDRMYWRADRYASGGALLDETFGNGVRTERSMDGLAGRLSRIATRGPAADLSDVTLVWNEDARLERRTETVGLPSDEGFVYDSLGRLTSWTRDGRENGAFEYDGRGNLISLSYSAFDSAGTPADSWGHALSFAGAHRTSRVDGASTTHDEFGRWTGVGAGGGGESWSASYNRFDLPTHVVRGGSTTRYAYDAFGSRVESERTSAEGTSTQLTFGGLFERHVAIGTSYDFRVQGTDGTVVHIHEDAAGTLETAYVHRDHLGSTSLVTDATGNVAERHRYTPFGERVEEDGSRMTGLGAPSLQSGFGGHRHEDNGFVDMRGRHYDPAIGRFLSVDPVNVEPLNPQSYNGYAYVMNDPLTYTDPTGFAPDFPFNGGNPGPWADGYGISYGPGDNGTDVIKGPYQEGGRRGNPAPARVDSRIVHVQHGAAPRAATPPRGMMLGLVQAPLLSDRLALVESRVPSAQHAAWLSQDEFFSYAQGAAEFGGSFVPVVGELMDVQVIFDDSEPGWARWLAGGSLVLNAATLGLAPNFGAWRRAGSRIATATATRSSRVARAAASLCFEEGTLVDTPNGKREIQDLRVGDAVYAYDEGTHELVVSEVTQTFERTAQSVVDLTILYERHNIAVTISGTPEHPFFVPALGTYVPMGALTPGTVLLTSDDAEAYVLGVTERFGDFEVFNFEVAGEHNYYVAAPESRLVGVLVHNTCRGLLHSFDRHAHEWFGRAVDSASHLDEWEAIVRRGAQSNVRFPWRTGSSDTIARFATIDGKPFLVQFFADGARAGELATAFIPSSRQMQRIRRLLRARR